MDHDESINFYSHVRTQAYQDPAEVLSDFIKANYGKGKSVDRFSLPTLFVKLPVGIEPTAFPYHGNWWLILLFCVIKTWLIYLILLIC